MNQRLIFASIITIGDELLIGQVVDTNSAWIAQELNKIGVWVKRRISVGDIKDDIRNALDEESKHSQIILMTGGLGPTADDVTKPLLCEYFGGEMIISEEVLNHVKYLFEKVYRRPGPILEVNLKQAEVPNICTVLHNARGTAPGMWFEKDGKVFVSMPGVPHEMKGLMQEKVLPRLKEHFVMPVIVHQTILTAGAGESMVADRIKHWEAKLPSHTKLAYLPGYGMVRLRLTSIGDNKNKLEEELEHQLAALKPLIAEWYVIDEDLSMPQVVGKMLKERKQTTSTAESCTGGYIAHLLTLDPGASSNYKGTVVCYDNEVKIDVLNVERKSIDEEGAVSEPVVVQMVKGALKELKTDYAIATSGIMGPDGGSEKKPVGMVWVAVGNKEKIITKEFQFRFDRTRNIELTAMNALNLLRKFILEVEHD
jgi:nicotinamide-nucleotide amidase